MQRLRRHRTERRIGQPARIDRSDRPKLGGWRGGNGWPSERELQCEGNKSPKLTSAPTAVLVYSYFAMTAVDEFIFVNPYRVFVASVSLFDKLAQFQAAIDIHIKKLRHCRYLTSCSRAEGS